MGKPERNKAAAGGSAPGSGCQKVDFDNLQQQLVELSEQDDSVTAMLNLINETNNTSIPSGSSRNDSLPDSSQSLPG